MKYTQLLPFLDKEELRKVASEIISGEIRNVRLETLFPFLGRDNMSDLVQELIEKKDSKTLQKALPFISKDKVQEIYQVAQKGELPDFDASRCIPFLGAEEIKKIFRELLHQASLNPDETYLNEEDEVDVHDED
jgi:predicted CopG family antitoxin